MFREWNGVRRATFGKTAANNLESETSVAQHILAIFRDLVSGRCQHHVGQVLLPVFLSSRHTPCAVTVRMCGRHTECACYFVASFKMT